MNMIEMNTKSIIINLQIISNFKKELLIIENENLKKNTNIKYFFEYKTFFCIVNKKNIDIEKCIEIIESRRDIFFFEMIIKIIMDVFIYIDNNTMLNFLNKSMENSENNENENENDYLIISDATKLIYNYYKYCHQIKYYKLNNIKKTKDDFFIYFDLP